MKRKSGPIFVDHAISYPYADAACSGPVVRMNMRELKGGSGYGFKSPVVKSDRIRPTPYTNFFTSVTAGTALSSHGSFIYCREGQVAVPYVRSASSDPSRLWHNPFERYFNGGFIGITASTGNMLVAASSVGAFMRPLNGGVLAEIVRLENMLLLDLAKQTNNLAITIAEAHKTSAYFVGKLKRVFDFLVELKHGTRKSFIRKLKKFHPNRYASEKKKREFYRKRADHLALKPWDKRLAARWLEYSYAITPVIMDVNGLIEYSDMSKWPPLVFSVNKRGTFYTKDPGSPGGTQNKAAGYFDAKVFVKHTFEVDDPSAFALNRLGITPLQATLGVAWELVPFSFVADWALGFNDYLKGVSAMQGTRWLHGHASILAKSECHFYESVQNRTNTGHATGSTNNVFGADYSQVPASTVDPVQLVGSKGNIDDLSNRFHPFRYETHGFRRVLRDKPRYNYSVDLAFLTKRRALSLLSLLSVLRK